MPSGAIYPGSGGPAAAYNNGDGSFTFHFDDGRDPVTAAGPVAKQMYDQTRQDLSPYREAGSMSLAELQKRMPELLQPFGNEQFQESPAYQFNLQQGQKAIEKEAAKRGTFYAPQTLQ